MQYRLGVKRVLMIQACREDWSCLETGLLAAGYSLLEVLPLVAELQERVVQLRPDMILAEADEPTPDILEKLAGIGHTTCCPVVMFSRWGSDRMVMTAMQSGVILHVVESLTPLLLHSLIEVAALYSLNQHLLQDELENLQLQLTEHRFIEQAKCLLMEQEGLTEQQAYARLRRTAMNRSQRLADVSRALLAARGRNIDVLQKAAFFKGL